MGPEFDQWLSNVSNHAPSLQATSIHITIPAEMVEEFIAFIEEPADIASQADLWLRRSK